MKPDKSKSKPVLSAPFDPLAVDNIGVTLAIELLRQPLHPLPPSQSFPGAGVYALYYKGAHDAYAALNALDGGKRRYPIYIGKAVRENAKQGFQPRPTTKARLYERLKNHAESIDGIGGLNAADFQCRFLTIQDAYIALAESVLITTFRPAWNGLGFGSKVVGKERMKGRPSLWDSLHPGRAGRPAGTGERQGVARDRIKRCVAALEAGPKDEVTKRMLEKIKPFY